VDGGTLVFYFSQHPDAVFVKNITQKPKIWATAYIRRRFIGSHMTPNNYSPAHDLARMRSEHTPGSVLPEDWHTKTFDEAFSLQCEVGKMFSDVAPSDVAGWKCALPSQEKTIVAALYTTIQRKAHQQCSLCSISPDSDQRAVVEPELAFELSHDLPS
jgi:hypothetical protein